MKRNLLIILLLCIFAAFPSCKRAPLTIGPIVTQTRELDDFVELYLNDNINLSLVRADTCYIEITTGANIIDNITTEVKDGVLTINNTTTLTWARPYNYQLDATLYYKDIFFLMFTASGNVVSENNFNGIPEGKHYYTIIIDGGSGDIDLNINDCKRLHIYYKYGTSRLTLHGDNNDTLSVNKRSYGIFDARNCVAKKVIINSMSSYSDCFINASERIKANIDGAGSIYYKGDPDTIQVTYGEFAKGRLISMP